MPKVVRIDSFIREDAKKTRVAAYARVSTDNDEQLASLEAQKSYYSSYIKTHKEWEYSGLFYDEGISGTKTDKRDGLLQLLEECRKGKIDFIIVKSISRLARNTVDCLEIVRELYDLGVYVYFEKENINTSKMSSELLLTILSGIAEGESKSISANEKWSIQKKFEQGTFVIGSPPYGYRNNDGKMEIVPEEAEIVRFIFAQYLAGKGSYLISKELNDKGIRPKKGKAWGTSGVTGILKNEKYIGDVLYQKTYTDDQFNRHRNSGEKNQYYVKNHHEAIISREEFQAAQELMEHHRGSKNINTGTEKYTRRYPFSGKIICGICGTTWKRRTHYTKSQGEYFVYVCESHLTNKEKCGIKYIREEDIKSSFCNVMNKLTAGRELILRPLAAGIRNTGDFDVQERISEIDKELEAGINQRTQLMNLFMKQYLDSEVYGEENEQLLRKESKLADEKRRLLSISGLDESKVELTESLLKFVSKGKMITSFSEEAFKEFVERIIVEDRHTLIFCMKCGLELKEGV